MDMQWTKRHGPLLAQAFEKVLGRPEHGSMAYARRLTPDVVQCLATDIAFAPFGWQVRRVADINKGKERTIRRTGPTSSLFEEIAAAGRHVAIMGHYSHPVELESDIPCAGFGRPARRSGCRRRSSST